MISSFNPSCKKQQHGFAMLEVVLAIVIIAIASFGIYKLYNTSTLNSKLSAEEDLISQIYSAVTQMSSSLLSQPRASDLYNYGVIPTSIWPSKDDNITGPFGGVNYWSDTKISRITAQSVPGSVAATLCAHMEKWGDTYVHNDASCTSDTVFAKNKFYNINVYFPKGKGRPK